MKFELMQLPYETNALEPYISVETISYHYGKHHLAYVNKLNALTEGTEYSNKSLEYIVKNADGAIFNNAAQVCNHDFYWHGLSGTATDPSVELSDLIKSCFGSIEAFKEEFISTAAGHFGSGWVWLSINEDKKLIVEATSNADNPIRHNRIPILTCDVWEHAYYIDYRNMRPEYLEKWWKLINWQFVSDNFANVEK
ncbi:superoxide dismutase [Candidatus Sulfurimonas marisnigri]|uniref:Superoxide dismutase n=1 Tax=Candidatus Sulfurimonas marisnigri TaxID=2740405 RepID=A0A7S7LYY1_9BACT|nr:superoxide dismutase [Candidatus Sulfurimonas marisnigri]QOY53855.1 superoxide dismutase [Candidatus Sulfurimonas marisnigri]